MKDRHHYGWYAARIKPCLPKDAFQPVPSRLAGGLIYLLLIIAGISILGTSKLSWPVAVAVSVALGFSFAGIGFLAHEILHGTVIRNRRLQSLFGGIALFPLCTGPEVWRKWHNLTHHVHTQHAEKDPDAWSSIEFLMTRPVLRRMYRLPQWFRKAFYFLFLHINFTFVSLLRVMPYLKGDETNKRGKVIGQFLLPWAFWFGLLAVLGLRDWLFAFAIPHLLANLIVSSYIATNHNLNPMTEVNDPLANSLTVTVPKWVDILHFNFSYHVEHHICPGVNPKYYPLIKEHIKRMWPERYHEMPFWKAMLLLFYTPRVYFRGTKLIDPATNRLYPTLGREDV